MLRTLTLFGLLMISLTTYPQKIKVEGKVSDAKTGVALTGVSVSVEGSANGSATDLDGKFVLNLDAAKNTSSDFLQLVTKQKRLQTLK